MPEHTRCEVIGVGAPIVDHVLLVSEEYVSSLPGNKGGATPVDYPSLQNIILNSQATAKQISGGSASNTLKGLAHLGHSCALIGQMGKDDVGALYQKRVAALPISFQHLIYSDLPTAQVACLITPDGQRTMRFYLGACADFKPSALKPEMFQGAKIVHIEGYTLYLDGITEKAMSLAKAAGALVSFDLASFEITKMFQERIQTLLTHYVDIVFANSDEAHTLTKKDPEKGCRQLMEICDTAVILQGAEGCWVGKDGHLLHHPAYAAKPLDTTGAGDFFISGFLHGYLHNKSASVCARYGSLLGAAAVHSFGAEIPSETWKTILSFLDRSQ